MLMRLMIRSRFLLRTLPFRLPVVTLEAPLCLRPARVRKAQWVVSSLLLRLDVAPLTRLPLLNGAGELLTQSLRSGLRYLVTVWIVVAPFSRVGLRIVGVEGTHLVDTRPLVGDTVALAWP